MAASSLLALGRHTITGLLSTCGRQFEDWSAAYRLFEKERVDRQALFAPALNTVANRSYQDEPLVVMMDDTLIRKRGKKVSGAGWKRDPLGPRFQTNFIWGQRFLQISAALPDTHVPGRARAVPIDFIHAPSPVKPRKTASAEEWKLYREKQSHSRINVIAAKRFQELRQQIPNKQIICSVDGGYTNRTMFSSIPKDTVLIGRIRKDARLFEVPPEETSPRRGRKRYYGNPLPTPEQLRKDASIPWQTVDAFAAGACHKFQVKTLSSIRWMGSGSQNMRLIIIRPIAYHLRKGSKPLYRDPAYLLCSDTHLPLNKLLQAYLWRWEIEVKKNHPTALPDAC